MKTVCAYVWAARTRLVESGLRPEEASIDAETLARSVLGWDRATYLSNHRAEAPSRFAHKYLEALNRREQREPVSLIIGRREFWGLDFEVTSDVLAPRPETEILVEEALARIQQCTGTHPHVVDVGTGSGCVAVAIALMARGVDVTATDISDAALKVARRNGERHGVGNEIRWVCEPFLDGVENDADLIVANLPYISEADIPCLPPEVRGFEPRIALDGGTDGLEAITRLLDEAPQRLAPSGHLLIEIGAGQIESVRQYVEHRTMLDLVGVRQDLQGIPRVVTIR